MAYLQELWRLPAGVRRFLATEALYGIGIGMYALVLNLHLLSQGLKADQVGTLASIGILIMGVSAIPVSLLANRLGRKRLLAVGAAFVAAGSLTYAVSESFGYFLIAQTLVSVGLTLVETTEVQLLFRYCANRKEETRAYSLMFAVFTAFTGAGMLAAGYLAGGGGDGGAYGTPLLLAAAILLSLGVLRAAWLPSEKRRDAAEDKITAPPGGAPQETRVPSCESAETPATAKIGLRRKLWLFAFFLALISGSLALTGSFLNVIVKFRLDWTDGSVSQLLAANGLILFVCSLLTPYLIERFGRNIAIVAVFASNLLLFALLYAQLPELLFVPLFLLRGGGTTMLSNLLDSQLMSAFSDRERNLFAGIRSVFRSAGSSGATYAAGWILAGEDYRLPFLLTAVALAMALAFYAKWIRPVL